MGGLQLAAAFLAVAVPLVQRALKGEPLDASLAWNASYMFQWSAIVLGVPFAAAFATGLRKLRAVAPLALGLISLLALVPLLAVEVTLPFTSTAEGSVPSAVVRAIVYGAFFVLTPGALWACWRVLRWLAGAYERKRFSDVQLTATMWWLIFVAAILAPLLADEQMWAFALGATSFPAFPLVLGFVFRHYPRQRPASGPTLLLLRLFGQTRRSEHLFDRVVARWRLVGPTAVITAPDVAARTFGPIDFLRFVTGRLHSGFVESHTHLEARLAGMDLRPDPDGRFRVNAFFCRDDTWRSTVVALISRSDAIVMDARGVTAGRRGVQFELEQLATQVPPQRVVVIIDHRTDLTVVEAAAGSAYHGLRLVYAERNSGAEARDVFDALLKAAVHPRPVRRAARVPPGNSSRAELRRHIPGPHSMSGRIGRHSADEVGAGPPATPEKSR